MTMLRFTALICGWIGLAFALAACGGDPSPVGEPDGSTDSDTDADTDADAECGPLAPGFEESFGSDWNGCGDVEIEKTNVYGECEVSLMFEDFDAPVFQMYYNGLDSLHREYELDGETSAALTVELGFDLSAGFCGEETEIDPEVLRSYAGTAGTAVLDLTAMSDQCTEESCPALADLELTDVVFTAADDPGDSVTLPYLLAEDVEIGY